MPDEIYKVGDNAPMGLNLRVAPNRDSAQVAVIPMGGEVKKLADSSAPKWWQVSARINETEMNGFVNNTFLKKVAGFVEPEAVRSIVSVHLTRTSPVTRRNRAWAFALNESGRPTRDTTASPENKVRSLTRIIEWLDVENTNNVRYKPTSTSTYCNIYAYDYCYLAGVYLPRVWWTSRALIDLSAGRDVRPVYGETVHELNANSLYRWFREFGTTFGWRRTASIDEMQNAANNGQAVIVSAPNRVPNRSGHICAVVPETSAQRAVRSGGIVTKPLQSQAGARNFRYRTDTWWLRLSSTFLEYGYWINAA